MKKKFKFIFILMFLVYSFTLAACDINGLLDKLPFDIPFLEQDAEYTITFYVDDEIYFQSESKNGKVNQLPDNPTKEGYEFIGWFTDNNYEAYKGFLVEYDLSLYARFEEESNKDLITIYFYVDNALFDTSNINKGEYIKTYTVPFKDGYEFDYWAYEDGSRYNSGTKLYEDTNLYAVFKEAVNITYNVSYYIDSLLIDIEEYQKGELLNTRVVVPDTGYKFLGWYYNGKLYDNNITVDKNIKLEAKFEGIDSENYSYYEFYVNNEIYLANWQPKSQYKVEFPTVQLDGFFVIGWKNYSTFGEEFYPNSPLHSLKCGSARFYAVLEENKESFEYELVENQFSITRYNGTQELVIIPESIDGNKIERLNELIFYYNKPKSIVIPNTIKHIVLDESYDDINFYYQGSWEEYNKIKLNFNLGYPSYVLYYYSETKPTNSLNCWHYVNGVPTGWGEEPEIENDADLNKNWSGNDAGVYNVSKENDGYKVVYNKGNYQEWSALGTNINVNLIDYSKIKFELCMPEGSEFILKLQGQNSAKENKYVGSGSKETYFIDLEGLSSDIIKSFDKIYIFIDWNKPSSSGEFYIYNVEAVKEEVNTEVFEYTLVDAVYGYYISNYSGNDTFIVIPSEYKNKPVYLIQNDTFSYSKVQEIIIPKSITCINAGAFAGCNDLKSVYYQGTEADWQNVYVSLGNESLTAAMRYYYSETEPTTEGNYWHYVDGKPVIWPNVLSYNVNFYVEGSLYHTEHVIHAGKLNLPVNPTKEGYNFVGWYYEEYGFMWDSSLYTVIYDMTLTAVFEEIISESTSFTYNEYEDYIEIVTYKKNSPTLTIPSYINGKPVTHLSSDFMELSGGMSYNLIFPDTLEFIAADAFDNRKGTMAIHVSSINEWLEITFESSTSNPLRSGYVDLVINDEIVTRVDVPNDIRQIKDYAFYGYSKLENINLNNVSQIGKYAFYDNNNIEKIKGASVINEYAFAECDNLKLIENGIAVSYIYPNAFANCKNLEKIDNASSVIYVGENAFLNCSKLNSLVFGSNLTQIDENAFSGCENLDIYLLDHHYEIPTNSNFTGNCYYYSGNEPTSEGNYWHYDNGGNIVVWPKIENIVINYYVDGNLYYSSIVPKGSTFVDIEQPKKKGYSANGWLDISGSKYLNGEVVNKSVDLYLDYDLNEYRISYYAYEGMINPNTITSYTIEDEVTILDAEKEGFKFIGWYTDEMYQNKITKIEKGSTGHITLYAVFEEIIFESTLFTYNEFEDYIEITGYTGNDKEICIPNLINGKPVKVIGKYSLFSTNFTSVTIGDNVERIENGAFESNKIETLYIGINVNYIASDAFYHSTNLHTVIVDSNNKVYDSRDNCNAIIETATNTLVKGTAYSIIPNTVTTIGTCAYGYIDVDSLCKDKYIVLPLSIKEIQENAFACKGIDIIYYYGNVNDWKNIIVEDEVLEPVIYYYSENDPTTEGNFWHYVDSEIVVWEKDYNTLYLDSYFFENPVKLNQDENGNKYIKTYLDIETEFIIRNIDSSVTYGEVELDYHEAVERWMPNVRTLVEGVYYIEITYDGYFNVYLLKRCDSFEITYIVNDEVYEIRYTDEPSLFPANPYPDGQLFIGWEYNGEFFDPNTRIVSDITLTAKLVDIYEEQNYHLVTLWNDQDLYYSRRYKDGSKLELPTAPLKEGYRFIGWYDGIYKCNENTIINSSLSLVAKYEKITEEEIYTINYMVDDESYHSMSSNRYYYSLNPVDPVKENYEFIGWFYNDVKWINDKAISQNITLEAKFNKLEFYYNEYDDYIEITKYIQTDEILVEIPDTYKDKPITHIASNAFYEYSNLETVIFGKNIKYIGENAFYNDSDEVLYFLYYQGTLDEWFSIQFEDNFIQTFGIISVLDNNGNSIYLKNSPDISIQTLKFPNIDTPLYMNCLTGIDSTGIIIPADISEINMKNYTGSNITNIYIEGSKEEFNPNLICDLLGPMYLESLYYFYSETTPTTKGNFWHYVDGKAVIWEKALGTVTFIVNDSIYVTKEITLGNSVLIDINPTIDGYVVQWWYDDFGNQYSLNTEYVFEESIVLTASLYRYKYNIDYIFDYEDVENNNPNSFNVGEEFDLEEAYLFDYVFEGWYLDKEFTMSYNHIGSDILDITLYGKFSRSVYSYNEYEDYIEITGLNEGYTALSMPNEIHGKPVTKIARNAFLDKYIMYVKLPSKLKSIGKNAFKVSDGLFAVEIESLSQWLNIEFENLYANPLSFGGVELSVKGVKVENIVIPNEITKINNYAFAGYNIKSIDFNNVVEIGDSSFYDSNFHISNNILNLSKVTKIGGYALGNTNVEYINPYMGYGYNDYSSTAFNDELFKGFIVLDDAIDCDLNYFYYTTYDVYYEGSREMWLSNVINGGPIVERVYYLSVEQPVVEGNYWHYVDGKPAIWPIYSPFEYIEFDTYIIITKYNGVDKDLVVPRMINNKPVEVIDSCAFEFITLNSIVIPDTVRVIGTKSFDSSNIGAMYFEHGKEEWDEKFANYIDLWCMLPTTIYTYLESQPLPTDDGDYWHYVNDVPVVW